MQCDARVVLFLTLFCQHRHLYRWFGVIIDLPQVEREWGWWCEVGKTVFIGRLAVPIDLL